MTITAIRTLKDRVIFGRTDEGYRVIIEVKYGPDDMGNAERQPIVQSVTHEQIPHPSVLSIAGEVVDRFRRDVSGGQIIEDVRAITKPAGTLTIEDLNRFADLWDAWHLNTMRAACAHMDTTIPEDAVMPERYGRPDEMGWLLANLVCPETGYTYGHAWLAEVVPPEIVDEIATILAKAHDC